MFDPDPSTPSSSSSFGRLHLLFAPLKAVRVIALFVAYDLLRGVHLVPAVFIVKVICAAFLVLRQKPFSASGPSSPPLGLPQISSCARFALLSLLTSLTWFYGLTLCGPLRAVLVTEHSPAALLAGLAAVFCGSGGAAANSNFSRARGAFFFALGTLALLLVDHDDNSPHHQAYHADHQAQHAELYAFFAHAFSWADVSDHKGGVLLLCAVLAARAGVRWDGRRAAVVVGGAKRLHALSEASGAVLLAPWALYHWRDLVSVVSSPWTLLCVFFVAATVEIADFYVETAAAHRSDRDKLFRAGALTSYAVALTVGTVWTHPVTFYRGEMGPGEETVSVTQIEAEDHQVSPGVIFATGLYCFAALNLTSSSRPGARGFFVGYSSSGLPLYNLSHSLVHDAGHNMAKTLKEGLRQILESADSRRIFYFLLLNLFFTFVEFAYGIWTNSLGLISDGFHMLFDCSALVMGLYASVLARWRPTKTFSFGYDRLEVLSGFVNGLFLAVISLNVFAAALRRLFDPPRVATERLLAVSVAGLAVNLVGIAAFSCGGGGGGGGGHGHSHGGGHGHSHNANMQGVFLHILADTLGSVSVIVSSVLIERFGLFIADPACSLFIAVTIFASVLPLLTHSAKLLVLLPSKESTEAVQACLSSLPSRIAGVRRVARASVWAHAQEKLHADVAVEAEAAADGQEITDAVIQHLRESGVHFPVVQVEKARFADHLVDGLANKRVVVRNALG